ncbi:ferredoxin-dependent glutamate synthase, chloroplastic [Tanacetum coccineum]
MNVGLTKWCSGTIRKQEAHSNGPILDDIILSDPEAIAAAFAAQWTRIVTTIAMEMLKSGMVEAVIYV